MKTKSIFLIAVLVLAFLTTLVAVGALPTAEESISEESKVETSSIQAEAVVFSEDFEGIFPGKVWTVGDWNLDSGEDYWDDISVDQGGRVHRDRLPETKM